MSDPLLPVLTSRLSLSLSFFLSFFQAKAIKENATDQVQLIEQMVPQMKSAHQNIERSTFSLSDYNTAPSLSWMYWVIALELAILIALLSWGLG
jgi:hypothetical protein